MRAKDQLGREGEARAAEYLTEIGYAVVERNWRATSGEIDIIAVHDCELAVVEVKTRRTVAFGDPLAAVDQRKLDRMWRLGMLWAQAHQQHARGRTLTLHVIGIIGCGTDAQLTHLADIR